MGFMPSTLEMPMDIRPIKRDSYNIKLLIINDMGISRFILTYHGKEVR